MSTFTARSATRRPRLPGARPRPERTRRCARRGSGGKCVAGAGRIAREGAGRNELRGPPQYTVAPREPWVTTTSRTAERRRVAEHLGLLVAQLQHPDVPQQLRGRSRRRAGAGRSARARTSPWPSSETRRRLRQRGERLEREVVAGERRDVHPASRGSSGRSARRPRVAERIDRHRPPVAVVGDRERRRRLAGHVPHRRPEPDQRRQQLGASSTAQRATTRAGTRSCWNARAPW